MAFLNTDTRVWSVSMLIITPGFPGLIEYEWLNVRHYEMLL